MMASGIPELYGSLVFNDSVMRDKLPKDVYQALRKTIENHTHLEPVSYTHLSSRVMPPTRLTVPVKYRSTTSCDRPMASKIWLPW